MATIDLRTALMFRPRRLLVGRGADVGQVQGRDFDLEESGLRFI